MNSIRFKVNIPRYIFGKLLGGWVPAVYWSGLSCMVVEESPEVQLPGAQWVKVRTHYGGICGSDMNTITLQNSTYYEPFASSPFTFGHENVGVIEAVGADAGGWQVGQRVIAEPTLWCAPRGLDEKDWCDFCKMGEVNRCENVGEGNLAPGLSIGTCRDTGGSWGPVFAAHRSQLYDLPDSVNDENALLVEPFACGLHASLQNMPEKGQQVLILGAGTIALMQLAALRALDCMAHITITARYPFQVEAAKKLGADEVLSGGDLYAQIAERTGAKIYQPILGKRVLKGGVDQVFECVGSDSALDDAIRLTRAGGRVVVVGVPGLAKGIDWSAIFDNELTVTASYIYNHAEFWRGRQCSTYDIALEMMAGGNIDLSWMVNRRYRLEEYKKAFKEVSNKRHHPIIKAVFEFP